MCCPSYNVHFDTVLCVPAVQKPDILMGKPYFCIQCRLHSSHWCAWPNNFATTLRSCCQLACCGMILYWSQYWTPCKLWYVYINSTYVKIQISFWERRDHLRIPTDLEWGIFLQHNWTLFITFIYLFFLRQIDIQNNKMHINRPTDKKSIGQDSPKSWLTMPTYFQWGPTKRKDACKVRWSSNRKQLGEYFRFALTNWQSTVCEVLHNIVCSNGWLHSINLRLYLLFTLRA